MRELLRALATLDGDDRYVLYARESADLGLDERFTWRRPGAPTALALPRPPASRDCDAFLSTNSYLTCWFTTCPAAIIVYDLVPFIPGAAPQRRASIIEHLTIDIGVRRARAVCISEATRVDLVERVPSAAGRSVVVPLAADARFADPAPPNARPRSRAHGIERPYVLAAGTLEPRKNLVRLLEAWASLREDLRDAYELVLVGPVGWEADEILSAAPPRGSCWPATSPTTSSPRCTPAASSSATRRSTRASACRCSRR